MTFPAADDGLFDFVKQRLFPAVVGDVMDTLGIVHQFLPPEVTALAPDMVVDGRAMPVLEADCAGTTIAAEARIDFRCPVELANGVRVEPGDLVFGDNDGVVVVPRAREREILQAALEKVTGENKVRSAIEGGMSAAEAFERFGIM